MQPAVRRLEEQYGDQVAFEYINAESERGAPLFRQLTLPGHPSYVLFSTDGKETFRTFGVVERDVLEAPIQAQLATP